GKGGRALVADRWRHLCDPRGEAGARHARRHARLAHGARAAPLAGRGVAALAPEPPWRLTMSSRSTATAPAAATLARAAGERCSARRGRRRRSTAARPTPPI